jgi:hypothetical protein
VQNRAFDLILGAQDIGFEADGALVTANAEPGEFALGGGGLSEVDRASEVGDSEEPHSPDSSLAGAGIEAAVDSQAAGRTTWDGIRLEQILRDRPDVLNAYFTEYNGPNNDPHSTAWLNRVGGTTPEDYADYWYRTYGSAAGHGQAESDRGSHAIAEGQDGVRTTSDGIPLSQILHDRPDVFQLFFTEHYGPNNDRNSHAWVDRVGGSTPEDYARYWYETGGKASYTPSDAGGVRSPVDPAVYAGGRTTSDGVYLEQILHDRPDVFQLFFTEYYGPNNDRHSSAWMDRVGGATPQDYAKYWYEHGGKYSYTPEPLKVDPPEAAPGGDEDAAPADDTVSDPDTTEMSPGADDAPSAAPVDETPWAPPVSTDDGGDAEPAAPVDPDMLLVGHAFTDPDAFGLG